MNLINCTFFTSFKKQRRHSYNTAMDSPDIQQGFCLPQYTFPFPHPPPQEMEIHIIGAGKDIATVFAHTCGLALFSVIYLFEHQKEGDAPFSKSVQAPGRGLFTFLASFCPGRSQKMA